MLAGGATDPPYPPGVAQPNNSSYNDNPDVLRRHGREESVDLVGSTVLIWQGIGYRVLFVPVRWQ